MAQGHKFLFEEFGITPNMGFAADEYGQSSVNAELLAEMGYDALYIGRTTDLGKKLRISN